jgi:hypothetical protein
MILGEKILDLGQSYKTIRAVRRAASSLKCLNPAQQSTESVSTGSFTNDGDDRIRLVYTEHNLRSRISTTTSFDPKTKLCRVCLGGAHAALAGSDGQPIVFAASDQNFPACVPARTTGKDCIRIVRVEDGSLQEITHALADAIGTGKLVHGTVIMLGSATHMANVGTEHYLTDWVRSRWWLRERFGHDKIILPLVPILVGGLTGRSTVRALVESLTWFSALSATEAVLMKEHIKHVLDTQLIGNAVSGWRGDRQCFRLPAGLDTRATVAMVSEGWGSWPESVPPLP